MGLVKAEGSLIVASEHGNVIKEDSAIASSLFTSKLPWCVEGILLSCKEDLFAADVNPDLPLSRFSSRVDCGLDLHVEH